LPTRTAATRYTRLAVFRTNTRTRACARHGVLMDRGEMVGMRARIRAILLERERKEAAVREAIWRLISRGPPTGSGIPFERCAVGIGMASLSVQRASPAPLSARHL